MPLAKELYWERKNKNLCTKCGETAEHGKTLCRYHLQQACRLQQAKIDRRKSKGQCPRCGQKLNNNRKICNDCLEKQVSKPRDDVYVPNTKRKELGLCISCGKPNPATTERCDKCTKKYSKTKSLSREQRIACGLCGQCGKGLLAENRKRCIICAHRTNKWYATSQTRLKNIVKNQGLKDKVVRHYGGKCNCCGEVERTFLAINHINGKGNNHRKQIGKSSGSAFYKWIIDQDFPDELQILCHNCNMSKHLLGGTCAHKLNAIGV